MANTIYSLPLRNDVPWYVFKAVLSNVVYTMHFRFNVRMNRWIMDIHDPSDNSIIDGLPLLINRNVNGQYAIPGLPPGTFLAVDNTNQGTQATLYSFGADHSLYYEDPLS